MNYKEFAKQLREKAVTDEYGIILCSPELWELICKTLEDIPTETNKYIEHIESIC